MLCLDELSCEIPPPVAPRSRVSIPRTELASSESSSRLEPVIRLRHRHRTWNHEVLYCTALCTTTMSPCQQLDDEKNSPKSLHYSHL